MVCHCIKSSYIEDMEKAQRDKEKEKKKRSKIKKKEKDERDAEEMKRAAVTRCEQKALASEEVSNRRVGRVLIFGIIRPNIIFSSLLPVNSNFS